ncbi:TPA: hypothetical protein P2Q89_004166 [Aeromonas veronii]|nr:hypothetical protein [Aeromonas veronii]
MSFYTTCKFGLIESIAKNNLTNKVASFHGVYGKSGDTVFFITYKTKVLSVGSTESNNVTELYVSDSNRVFISRVIINSDDTDWIILQHPYYTIHKSKHIGRLGFF